MQAAEGDLADLVVVAGGLVVIRRTRQEEERAVGMFFQLGYWRVLPISEKVLTQASPIVEMEASSNILVDGQQHEGQRQRYEEEDIDLVLIVGSENALLVQSDRSEYHVLDKGQRPSDDPDRSGKGDRRDQQLAADDGQEAESHEEEHAHGDRYEAQRVEDRLPVFGEVRSVGCCRVVREVADEMIPVVGKDLVPVPIDVVAVDVSPDEVPTSDSIIRCMHAVRVVDVTAAEAPDLLIAVLKLLLQRDGRDEEHEKQREEGRALQEGRARVAHQEAHRGVEPPSARGGALGVAAAAAGGGGGAELAAGEDFPEHTDDDRRAHQEDEEPEKASQV
mmetsp:Transcript_84318/g.212604  ORF Transcript_84318/g.212604 Transcript_84318/m.212604 type:complete len:334 (+) Transcript_84318:1046-2047(+)